jgi:hypothetical protein
LGERLAHGPAYLFLGQRWLTNSDGTDPFLQEIVRKFGGASTGASYSALIDSSAAAEPSALDWMAGRCQSIPPPERMESVAWHAWNGVFTSAIDDIMSNMFRNPTRDVQRVMSADYQPADPRSRSKLHIWHLFGNVAAPDEVGRPPLARLDLIKRKGVATQMAASIPALLTPLGVLCVDGYDPASDWFDKDQFYQAAAGLGSGQIHWFSAPEAAIDDYVVRALLEGGQLVLHKESLAQALLVLRSDGTISRDEDFDENAWVRRIRIAKRIIAVPEETFRQIHTTGRLITEQAFAPLKKLSREQTYSEFRSFLYESSHSPLWEGYSRGFAFRRDFQKTLEDSVRAQLAHPSARRRAEPIILHGATGSGKTVALGQMAFDLQAEGQYPVIFVDRGTRFRGDTIDRFCQWAEDAEAGAVVIVWDGMMSPREYLDIHSFFTSRGRKFVLVGSAYQTDVNFQQPKNSVPVSGKMELPERTRFVAFLKEIGVEVPGEAERLLLAAADNSFLSQLYRTLPATRPQLQAGLAREVARAGELLRSQRIVSPAPEGTFGTNLGDMFASLGMQVSEESFGEKTGELAGETIDEVQQLIGLVMVPGQFGLATPFELLMRAIGSRAGPRLLEILKAIDIFNLREDNLGNPMVDARTALEAQLITRARLGSAKSEIDYAVRLLGNIRLSFVTGAREVDFAVDLLRNVGPNGPKESYYKPYFQTLASCLRALRTEAGTRHPRLLLQESLLLREAAKTETPGGETEISPEKRDLLDQALEVCNQALNEIDNSRPNRPLKTRLMVELASTWGTLAKAEQKPVDRVRMVDQAHETAWKAFSLDPGNHYALDVVAWTARDLLQKGGVQPEDRLRIVESVTHAFALADAQQWDTEAANQLDRRRVELRDVVFDESLSEIAFNKLLARGSAAGVVVRAWQLAESRAAVGVKPQKEDAIKALEWMDLPEHQKVVAADAHASFLRFRLWWRAKLGFDFNSGERIAVPFDVNDWEECLRTVGTLLTFEQFSGHPTLRLIEAVALFHIGDSSRGFDAFDKLATDQLFVRNRVVRRFVFSDGRAAPRRFNGTVLSVQSRDGSLHVQGLSRRIPFFVQESPRRDLRVGDDLQGFGISFNMLGPIAEFRLGETRL